MRKTCLIYGHNGLDLDVAFNLRSFYNKIGFNSYFDTKLHSANVISIVRGVDSHIDLRGIEFEQIHVYDYGGWKYDRLVKSLPFEKSFIFTTSPDTKEDLIKTFGFPEKNIFIALPPVDIKLFSSNLKPIKYNLIHIGNYKKIDDDIYHDRLKSIIDTLDVKVWGMNWDGHIKDNHKLKGRSGFFESSEIYSETEYALGLMYPFQREVTFSGRFWQSTLNGCFLFSESGLYSKSIPGIIETDYTIEDIQNKMVSVKTSREQLIKDAREYWNTNNKKNINIYKKISSYLSDYKIGAYSYYKYKFLNKLRIIFHRLNVWCFFKHK